MPVPGERSQHVALSGGGGTQVVESAAAGVNWRVVRAIVSASHASSLVIKDSSGTSIETLRIPAGDTKDFSLHLNVADGKGISVTGDGALGWAINLRIHYVRVFS